MLLHLSFKKIVPFVLKVVIWALKAKKWPCPPLPIKAQNTVKKLGIDLSFSSSLVCAGFRRKKLTYLSYHPTFSVHSIFLMITKVVPENQLLKPIMNGKTEAAKYLVECEQRQIKGEIKE